MERYKILIYERYTDLLNSNKEFDNYDLSKIFEYYSCIKLSEELNKPFYEYNDINPTFKEINNMTRNDTGIDLCDLENSIVQCKLRKYSLTWKECGTFFGSQCMFDDKLNKTVVKWNNLIITRNECKLCENLVFKSKLFIDRIYPRQELINYCDNLIKNPPKYPEVNNDFKLRDYQLECIDIINKNNNVIINLPTGTGKNSVIIYSLKDKLKYLILVPRIILMEQLKEEIIKHKPKYKKEIQLIGDSNNDFNKDKLITICVFNSVHIVKSFEFNKIYIDEAHHINKPEIYYDLDSFIESESEIESASDSDDEETNKYIDIIKSFTKLNNNVYLSATIDESDNFTYYNKDIRHMIDLGYLCDYNICVPIFTDDPSNKNICEYLIRNYKNIIIYCNSQKEGKTINKQMNEIQNNSSNYIDCLTPKKKRNSIINKYKNGEIPFLVNVRILVEGFDSPITKGVCFLNLPSNKTTLIQIIGRALRLHPMKTIANIIIPYSNEYDEKGINSFLKVIANNDSRIIKSYQEKKLGGYINIDNIDVEDEETIEFKYNMIYNSFGELLNGQELWESKLKQVKKYINVNKKRPSITDKNKNYKQLSQWLSDQQRHYKKGEYIMKNDTIKQLYEEFIKEYKEYFTSNEELWKYKLEQIKEYINKNKNLPSETDKNNKIKQSRIWLTHQRRNYIKREQIMKDETIRKLYEEFIKKYKKYLISNEEIWKIKLNQVKKYIIENKKKPSRNDKNKDYKQLGSWLSTQQSNYKKGEYIMKDKTIKKLYEEFKEYIKEYYHLKIT